MPAFAAGGGPPQGWTLDVMRRLPDGFRYTMEFLIASACLTFKEEDAECKAGKKICVKGVYQCMGGTFPVAETCNDLDDERFSCGAYGGGYEGTFDWRRGADHSAFISAIRVRTH